MDDHIGRAMKRHGTRQGSGEGIRGERKGFNPLAVLAFHLLGIVAVAVGMACFVLPGAHIGILWEVAFESGEVGRALIFSAVVHLGLSTLVWFAAAAGIEALWCRRHRLRRNQRSLQRCRGSAYVEFLAVLPVFLLLTFGLLQLTMINIGAALAQVAAYESARAVWLWQPEVDHYADDAGVVPPDAPVTMEDVAARARIAAALVMTPVAPGDYRMTDPLGSEHEAFRSVRDAMTVRFDEGILTDWGALSDPDVELDLDSRQATLVSAFDGSDIEERAFRKFTFSYLATDIDLTSAAYDEIVIEGDSQCESDDWEDVNPNNVIDEEVPRLGVEFSYFQHMAMPFVDRVFGQPHDDGDDALGRGGQYLEWDIKFTFPMQRQCPNRELP